MRYRLFNWYIDNIDCLEDYTSEFSAKKLSVSDTFAVPTSNYFYNAADINNNTIGNTIEVVCSYQEYGNAPFCITLADGAYECEVTIEEGSVSILGNTFQVDTENFNRYTLSMKDNFVRLSINKLVVFEGNIYIESTETYCRVGFHNYVSGIAACIIKYLKCCPGFKRYIDLSKVFFELQVDTEDTFDSPNLKTYVSNSSGVSCTQDSSLNVTQSGVGLVRSFTFPMLPRQSEPISYFFRVKIVGDEYSSEYAYSDSTTQEVNYRLVSVADLENLENISVNNFAFVVETSVMYRAVPKQDLIIDGINIIKSSDTAVVWKKVSNSFFILSPNISEQVFNRVYIDRLPGRNVYTKVANSGNIANDQKVKSELIDVLSNEITNTLDDLNIATVRPQYLSLIWGDRFNISSSYFSTSDEYRRFLWELNLSKCNPTVIDPIIFLISALTGVEPTIYELKEYAGWVLYDEDTTDTLDISQVYSLFDVNHPYVNSNTAVLYSENGYAHTATIEVFNPYNVAYSSKLIQEVIRKHKKAHSSINLLFYDGEGRQIESTSVYKFDNYGDAVYTPSGSV